MIPWNKLQWADSLIVPGERIGGFLLGKQPAEFLPSESEGSLADWTGRAAVAVEIDPRRGVVDATTGDGRYRTAEGFKVGTDFSDIVQAWGEPTERRDVQGEGYFDFKATYASRGVDFAVKDGAVLYVGVFLPDAHPEVGA